MPENKTKTFNVLLVEDEPTIRDLVEQLLTELEVVVDCSSNGTEAVRMARAKRYQLILMDVVLPEMDGITACRLLKEHPATAAIPLFMMTGKTKPSDLAAASQAGADGYIRKPFRAEEISGLVLRFQQLQR